MYVLGFHSALDLTHPFVCVRSAVREVSVNVPLLVDGTNTNTPADPTNNGNTNTAANVVTTFNENNANRRGRHESEGYYYECRFRRRNRYLFVADRNLSGVQPDTKVEPTDQQFTSLTSIYTMQNNNGERRGLECPEERDYYPYWRPTPWRDIAVIADAAERFCLPNGKLDTTKWPSQNDKLKYKCTRADWNTTNVGAPVDVSQTGASSILSAYTEQQCVAAGGVWRGFSWGLEAPDCKAAEWTRVNHLGNGRNGQMTGYNWTVPTVASLAASGAKLWNVPGAPSGTQAAKCVVRLRYNISTDDYDPYGVSNQNSGPYSPVRQDPKLDIGAPRGEYLQVNLNTNQDHRTFQDRSHTFWIINRPAALQGRNIYNLNVRGKRGNIVQTYPANEYDFVPNYLKINAATDLIHLQWTGSNTHNNGGGGGDGQAGDDGEGKGGSDRSNLLQIGASRCNESYIQQDGKAWCGDLSVNLPLPYDKFMDNMFSRARCIDPKTGETFGNSWVDCALSAASAGFFENKNQVATAQNSNTPALDVTMNNAPASYRLGMVLDYSTSYPAEGGSPGVPLAAGTTIEYYYMCSRNNNFSNRSQKGTLIVQA